MPNIWLRLGLFAAVLAVLLMAERLSPARAAKERLAPRGFTNLAFGLMGAGLARVMGPLSAAGAALLAEAQGLGLLRAAGLDETAAFVISLLALDAALYVQHRAMHAVSWLWRLHRVHHIDPDLDVTTALRFHPLESVLSQIWKAAVIAALGVPVIAALIFEIVLNLSAMFNHANLRLPAWLERGLRLFIVTPGLHAVHHSPLRADHDRNFGFALSIWDGLGGTLKRKAERDEIGQEGESGAQAASLLRMVLLPFQRVRP